MPLFSYLQLTAYHSTVFNQKTLYDAYKKRTKNVEVDLDDYSRLKEADPEFYREASSLQYGKVSMHNSSCVLYSRWHVWREQYSCMYL